jgi:15-hydroxyprostaglandin dehydrogenase (NAD)
VIVNVASIAGLYPMTPMPIYATTKAGVIHLTRSLQHWNQVYNIRVNAVAPSFVETNLTAPLFQKDSPVYDLVKNVKLIPIEWVVDAMIQAIEDDSLSGDVIRVTPEYGITVIGRSKL